MVKLAKEGAESTQSVTTEPNPRSYVAALNHFSKRASSCAAQNRKIDQLRFCSDLELEKLGLKRSEIETYVYKRQ